MNNTLRKLKLSLVDKLVGLYDAPEAESIVQILFENITGYNKIDQILNATELLSEEQSLLLNKYAKDLLQGRPLQYVLGEAYFYDRKYFVEEGVLIPRPETEELVLLVLKSLNKDNPKILDIGTGSGIIPITLALECKNAIVYATDISRQALSIARKNAKRLKANVEFIEHDIFSEIKCLPRNLDCLVSNPPYITDSEKSLMEDHVLNYEPHLALFVSDENPLVYYKRIAEIAYELLNIKGILLCEINEGFAQETKECFEKCGFGNVFVYRDVNNKNRIVKAEKIN